MSEYLLEHEQDLRSAIFYGAIIVIALWEFFLPRRALGHGLLVRWSSNLAVGVFNLLFITLALPVGAMGIAFWVESHGWGLLNLLSLPAWLAMALAVLGMDLIKYLEHRVFHAVPLLWRLHQVHHADLDVDFTTAYRHHPFEVMFSGLVFIASVFLLGAPALAVLLYQMTAAAVSTLVHGNLRLAMPLDGALRCAIVSPDMHIVHHSSVRRETDSNFALVFAFWDRLFGTYCARPAAGIQGMTIGLEYFRKARDLRIDRLLAMPFIRPLATAPEPAPSPIASFDPRAR